MPIKCSSLPFLTSLQAVATVLRETSLPRGKIRLERSQWNATVMLTHIFSSLTPTSIEHVNTRGTRSGPSLSPQFWGAVHAGVHVRVKNSPFCCHILIMSNTCRHIVSLKHTHTHLQSMAEQFTVTSRMTVSYHLFQCKSRRQFVGACFCWYWNKSRHWYEKNLIMKAILTWR